MKKTLINKMYIRNNDVNQVARSYIDPLISLISSEQVLLLSLKSQKGHQKYKNLTDRREVTKNEILSWINDQSNDVVYYNVNWHPGWPSECMEIIVSCLTYEGRDFPPEIQKTICDENIVNLGEQVICCEMFRQFDCEETLLQEKADFLKNILLQLEEQYHCIYGFVHCQNGFVNSLSGACTRMNFANTYSISNGFAFMECYTEGGFWLNLFSPSHIRRIGGLDVLKEFGKESSILQIAVSGNVFYQLEPSVFIAEDTVVSFESLLKNSLLKIAPGNLRDYSAQVINSVAPGALNKVKNINVIKKVFDNSVYHFYHEIRNDAIRRLLVSKGESYIYDIFLEHPNYTPEAVFIELFEKLPALVALMKNSFGERTIVGMTWEELCRTRLNEIKMNSQGIITDYCDSLHNNLFYSNAKNAEKAIKKLDPRIKAILNEYPDANLLFTFNASPDISKLKELNSAIKSLAEKTVSSGEHSGASGFINDITVGEDGAQWLLFADMGTVALDDFLAFCADILKTCDKLQLGVKEITIT